MALSPVEYRPNSQPAGRNAPRSSMRKRMLDLLKVAFGVGMLAWISRGIHVHELLELARKGNTLHLLLGVSCLLAAMMYFQWTRLHVLIKSYTGGIASSLKIFYIGALFNNLLPSNIGGDAIRLIYLRNLKSDNWGTPFMLLMLHRLSSFIVLIAAGLFYIVVEHARLGALLAQHHLLIQLSTRSWLLALAAALLCLGGAAFVVRRLSAALRTRVLGFLGNCRQAFAVLSVRDVVSLVVHTLLFHLFRMLSFYYLARYFGQTVSLWDLVFVMSATAIAGVLPITVAGLGVMEGSISMLLALYGVADDPAKAVALINRAVLLLMAAIGGIVYASTRSNRPQPTAARPKPSPTSDPSAAIVSL